ncbi:hypothetical protein SAMN02745133_00546 [Desulforamulus putei DSM 12395]|uniref:Uncharacterized protein n=1 Tax=Desulforamulus putei DSM 12395 TaxID=1121429 RepID=A0A1M4U1N8_9FIRM|nr:hypothetical protein SAMN02745133_00546 [Desulforamulus putei DSM 12395]
MSPQKLLEKERDFRVVFGIDSTAFSLAATLVWLKQKDEILCTGFKFKDIHPKDPKYSNGPCLEILKGQIT